MIARSSCPGWCPRDKNAIVASAVTAGCAEVEVVAIEPLRF